MRILVDTNVLLRSAQPSSPHHSIATGSVSALRQQGHELCLVPQVFYEFWVVATRPVGQNGLGLTASQADADIQQLSTLFHVFRDERAVFDHWRQIVIGFGVIGKNAHDARLVAAMQRHSITDILTFNGKDFQRFTFISTHLPQ